ncbi:MAG: HNH endonuclease signature motif containing protein [Salinirussus sp.]
MGVELSATEARRCFCYEPDTGILYWRVHRGKATPGKEAGSTELIGGVHYKCLGWSNRKYSVHRVIWLLVYGEWPNGQIDHIDGDGTNNRLSNLRDVDAVGNSRNKRLHSNNTSGSTGVTRSRGMWQASIYHGKRTIFLGRFPSFEEARKARKKAETEYGYHPNHGERK